MATATKKRQGKKQTKKPRIRPVEQPANGTDPEAAAMPTNGRADGQPTDEQVRRAVGMPFPHLSSHDRDEAIADFYRHNLSVAEAANEVLKSQGKVDQAKGELKAAEAHHAQEVKALSSCILEWCEPNLFNQQHKPGRKGTAAASAGDYPPEKQSPDADAWRKERLELLIPLGGLTQSKLEKINGIDIYTMGDLSDWLRGPPLRNYVDLPGIGKGWVEKLETAMERFWRDQGYAVNAIAAAQAVATVVSEEAAAEPETADATDGDDARRAAEDEEDFASDDEAGNDEAE